MIKSIFLRRPLLAFFLVTLSFFSSSYEIAEADKISVDLQIATHSVNTNVAFVANEVIVKYKRGHDFKSIHPLRSANVVASTSLHFGYELLQTDGDVLDICNELLKSDAIISAEPNYVRHVYREPNDPLWPHQFNLKLSNATSGWNITTGKANVTVAVIDTGIDYNHPDLIANLLPGSNFRNPGNDYLDDSGHGTGVSGCVAAVGNNEQGITGVAWNVKILPLRACGGDKLLCSVVHEADAIMAAIDRGADVINLSLGGFERSSIEEDAINAAWNAGIVIVAAVGNQGYLGKFNNPENEIFISFPAGYDNVIGVGSVDYPPGGDLSKIQRSEFSNYGDAVSVTAMGSNILTTSPSYYPQWPIFGTQKDYGKISGTSFSTPIVSGLAALIKSQFPELSNVEIRRRIESTTWDIGKPGWDDHFGYGLVNFHSALIGGTYAENESFAFGVTTSPILNSDIIVIVKAKVPIIAVPIVNYVLIEGNNEIFFDNIPLRQLPGHSTVFTGRLTTSHNGPVRFKVSGSNNQGLLQSIEMEYFKENN